MVFCLFVYFGLSSAYGSGLIIYIYIYSPGKVTVEDATERQSIGEMKMRRGQEISYEERVLDKLTETSLVPIFLIVFKGSSNRDTE